MQGAMSMKLFKMGVRIRAFISKEDLEKSLRGSCSRSFAVFYEPNEDLGRGSLFTILFEDDDDRSRFIKFRRGQTAVCYE